MTMFKTRFLLWIFLYEYEMGTWFEIQMSISIFVWVENASFMKYSNLFDETNKI